MKRKIYAIIVIYNSMCSESKTIRQIINNKFEIQIVVVDNSTIETKNEKYCKNNGIIYISMNGNKGLSKAYNKGLELIKNEDCYIMLLDQDTIIPNSYFENVINLLSEVNNKFDLIVPIIYCNNKIISPTYGNKFKRKLLNSINEINLVNEKNIYAINSCLIINNKLFNDFSYNENLFLDFIDNDFFDFVHRKKIEIKIIETGIDQNLFILTNNNYDKFLVRYKNIISDAKKYYSNSIIEKLFLIFKLFFWGIKYAKKYKKLSIIIKTFIFFNGKDII